MTFAVIPKMRHIEVGAGTVCPTNACVAMGAHSLVGGDTSVAVSHGEGGSTSGVDTRVFTSLICHLYSVSAPGQPLE